jgi:hypothetical protein
LLRFQKTGPTIFMHEWRPSAEQSSGVASWHTNPEQTGGSERGLKSNRRLSRKSLRRFKISRPWRAGEW